MSLPTVMPMLALVVMRGPLSDDCDFELRTTKRLTSEEWGLLLEHLAIARRGADRFRQKEQEAISRLESRGFVVDESERSAVEPTPSPNATQDGEAKKK